MTRVAVVDDQTLFRKGLRRLLASDGALDVAWEADGGRAAIDRYRGEPTDVVVTDLVMPDKDGMDLTKELRALDANARVLVLTMHHDVDHGARLLRAGALGFVPKTIEPEELVEAVKTVARGERYLTRDLALAMVDAALDESSDPSPLTDRELQVMRLIALGRRSREIAEELCISQKTVDTHRASVLRKLHLQTNADVARYAVRKGYVVA